ncbi:MAG: KamA family radical SAM protein [Ruminococcus sp.]|nr:KamA family radical SAM protein [Ruminococcus sp.]
MQTWESEIQRSITDLNTLNGELRLNDDEKELFLLHKRQIFKITPHLINVIKNDDINGKVRKQFIPSVLNDDGLRFEDDFLCESSNEVCENLIVRYPNKAILLVTQDCPAYCQFCTRKRLISGIKRKNNIEKACRYLEAHPEIYDIVITGGDPFILFDEELAEIFNALRSIKTIKLIRINTRTPVSIPNRITEKLIHLLKQYEIYCLNIHFEHPSELSEQTVAACRRLADNGIILGSQSVLLKNINNSCEVLKDLFLKLIAAKVRPYYLYQCDKVRGCEPFYTDPNEGIEIINNIQYELPGLCVPRFVIDAPDKMGKITVGPNGIVATNHNSITLKNYNTSKTFDYFLTL